MTAMNRLESVEAMRGIAAFSVAFFHFTIGSIRPEGMLQVLGSVGWLGVEVFFVISGFVIPMSMWERNYSLRKDVFRFVARRLVRLEPAYLLTVVGCIALWHVSAMMPGFKGTPPQISLEVIALHAGYLIAFFDQEWLNPVFWTLAIEFQFYIAISLVFPLLSSKNRLLRLSALIALVGLSHIGIGRNLLPYWFGLFAAGILTWMTHARQLKPRGFIVLSVILFISNSYSLGVLIASVGLATSAVLLITNFPKMRPLAFLGTISYSLYLIHVPIGGRVINLMERLPESDLRNYSAIFLAFMVSILAAYIIYRLVELPSQRLSQRIGYGQRGIGTAPAI